MVNLTDRMLGPLVLCNYISEGHVNTGKTVSLIKNGNFAHLLESNSVASVFHVHAVREEEEQREGQPAFVIKFPNPILSS